MAESPPDAPAVINGRELAVRPGETILQGARRLGIDIPTLCHHERLTPEGGCRMCLVKCSGHARPLAACHTPLEAGMEIMTHHLEVERLRKTLLRLHLSTTAESGLEPGAIREGRFTELLVAHGFSLPKARPRRPDASHPFLRWQPAACVSCRLCLNACEQIPGNFVFGVEHRGAASRLVMDGGRPFVDGACSSCGACVDVCPTGAISDADRNRPREMNPFPPVDTICGSCAMGCGVRASRDKRGDISQMDGLPTAAVNHGELCGKGRYGHNWLQSFDRLRRPMRRQGPGFEALPWDDAIALTARRFREIAAESGPDAVAALVSGHASNEAAYLLQKYLRGVIGTNNLDGGSRLDHAATDLALAWMLGSGAASACFDDVDLAGCLLVVGANVTESHPVLGAKLKQAALRGVPLIVIDPRRTDLADFASLHLPVLPGTNVALLNILSRLVLEAGGESPARAAASRGQDYAEWRDFVGNLPVSEAAAITGTPERQLRAAARLIAGSGPLLILYGNGVTQHVRGTAGVITLANLCLLTGSLGQPGGGLLPLRGPANAQGVADMGALPDQLPGGLPLRQALQSEAARARLGYSPPPQPGLSASEIPAAILAGKVRALWVVGANPVRDLPPTPLVREALAKLDFLVVQDTTFSETCRIAHVLLPAAGSLEIDGTYTSLERRIQRVRPITAPQGEARPDWVIISQIARASGAPWHYVGAGEVLRDIAGAAPDTYGGISFPALDQSPDGLQWPCPEPGHPGTPRLYANGFLPGKGRFVAIDYEAIPEARTPELPLLLSIGGIQEHHSSAVTVHTPHAALFREESLVLHPHDASRLRLLDGDEATVSGSRGSLRVPLRVSSRQMPGTARLNVHDTRRPANLLVSGEPDPDSLTPAYKAIAVNVSR